MRNSSLKCSGMTRVNEEWHSFTCHPHIYPQVEFQRLRILYRTLRRYINAVLLLLLLLWLTDWADPTKHIICNIRMGFYGSNDPPSVKEVLVLRSEFNPTRPTWPCYNNTTNKTKHKIHIHKNESKHGKRGPPRQNLIQRTTPAFTLQP